MSNESKQPAAQAKTLSAKQVGNLLLDNALYILMVIAVIVIQIVNPNFLRPASLVNILSQTAAYLPAALGIAGCIVLTGTDLSAGRAVGLTACISASLLQVVGSSSKMWPEMGTLPVALVILIAVLLGAAIGAFNGFFVAKFKLHPFIVTLGTQLILYSCLLLYVQMGNNGGMAISSLDASYTGFIKGSIVSVPTGNGTSTPIPNYVWFAILLTALMWFIWNKTTFGKNMFALGSNEEAARVSGVKYHAVDIGGRDAVGLAGEELCAHDGVAVRIRSGDRGSRCLDISHCAGDGFLVGGKADGGGADENQTCSSGGIALPQGLFYGARRLTGGYALHYGGGKALGHFVELPQFA